MKKQKLKKRTKKFEEKEDVVNNKESKGVLRKGQCKSFFNNNYGITLIALVITVIVLLILARHFYKHAKPVTTAF